MRLDPSKLDPGKIRRKGSATRQAALFAVEWSAIIFSGMLAVLFLSWALELLLPQINISNGTESARAFITCLAYLAVHAAHKASMVPCG